MVKEDFRKQLEQIIQEEVQKELQEGFLDRIMAKANGNMSSLKQMGRNVGQVFKAITTGQNLNLGDPRVAKAAAIGASRVKEFNKQFNKIIIDMGNDLELMFGKNFENAPPQLKKHFMTWAEETKDVLTTAQVIHAYMEDMMINTKAQKDLSEEIDLGLN